MPFKKSLLGEERLDGLRLLAVLSHHNPWIEVGVYGGGSAKVLYEESLKLGTPLFLYDTFEGIPFSEEDVDAHKVGDFGDGLTYEECCAMFPRAHVEKGIFGDNSILPENIGFAHLDVDQRKSYEDAIRVIFPRLIRGGIILCDDWVLPGAQMQIIRSTVSLPMRLTILPDQRALIVKE